MALKNYVAQTERVEFPGGEFDVRGLSLNDVLALVVEQKNDLERVFDFVEANGVHVGNLESDLGFKLLQTLPDFAVKLIVLASGERDAYDQASKLPVPVQFDALTRIARLTFVDAAGFRVFVGKVLAAVQGAKGALPQNLTHEPA